MRTDCSLGPSFTNDAFPKEMNIENIYGVSWGEGLEIVTVGKLYTPTVGSVAFRK